MDKLNLKNITTFKTLNYHTSFIMCLLILNDGRLASSSDDGSIIIYDKETFNPQCEIKEFEYAVNNIIQLSYNNYLISSCADKTITIIKLTSLTTYNIISILDNHYLSVNRVIELDNFEIASCSDDQTVKIYSKESSSIEKKYPVPNTKGTRIYVSINPDPNCRCAFIAISEFRNEIMKEIELLHKENNELKSLIKEKNDNIVKLNKTVKDLQSEVTKMKNESSIYFRSKTQA